MNSTYKPYRLVLYLSDNVIKKPTEFSIKRLPRLKPEFKFTNIITERCNVKLLSTKSDAMLNLQLFDSSWLSWNEKNLFHFVALPQIWSLVWSAIQELLLHCNWTDSSPLPKRFWKMFTFILKMFIQHRM